MQHSAFWRWCAAGTAMAALLTGCASGKSRTASISEQIEKSGGTRTAHYQQDPVDEIPAKVSDPVSLKLRYAKWMEEVENFPEATQNYNVVLQERPEDVDALLGLARIDQAAGRSEDAEAGFKKALSLRPQAASAKNALGQFYASQQRWAEALPLLSEAMMGDPANKVYRYHLAVALAKSGDIAAAVPHFNQSVGEAAAHYNVAMILKQQGQNQRSEQELLQALAKNPNFEPARQALAAVREHSHVVDAYATQQRPAPQIQTTGHQSGQLTPTQQEQLRNQRALLH